MDVALAKSSVAQNLVARKNAALKAAASLAAKNVAADVDVVAIAMAMIQTTADVIAVKAVLS